MVYGNCLESNNSKGFRGFESLRLRFVGISQAFPCRSTGTPTFWLFLLSKFLRNFGFKFDEIIGKTPSLWGGLMPKPFYEEMWRQISQEKKSVSVEVMNRRKDGEKYWANLRISPVLDTQGEVKFFVGVESIKQKIKK